jgi:hypothetical protein
MKSFIRRVRTTVAFLAATAALAAARQPADRNPGAGIDIDRRYDCGHDATAATKRRFRGERLYGSPIEVTLRNL